MDLPMNQDKLKNLIASIPTDQLKSDEIEPFIQQMRKHLIEQALQGEMGVHLGYDRYERYSCFFAMGTDINIVKEAMGHASVSTTQRYGMRGVEAVANATKQLGI